MGPVKPAHSAGLCFCSHSVSLNPVSPLHSTKIVVSVGLAVTVGAVVVVVVVVVGVEVVVVLEPMEVGLQRYRYGELHSPSVCP